ncbi:hypothetical protein Poli38472_000440 [Pythium oligandrum]|uniref:MSP domain-containing protein n=1 Tax=Pythium oligandrum TaxID=41045 RepID=A0A8K1CD31_PYTOL|nr:hypothetical protein Poli38472_000440 [Pythium oligandrum]|eukprot:TMW60398.1 hypothetical protein Poli38472_000440 [Pythium oligandrum]
MEQRSRRMKPSELRTAFAAAKTRASRQPAPTRIIDFANADDHTTRVSSTVPLHKPLFEPMPAEVWIDEYTPFQMLTTKLSFRNCDSVARRFKIEPVSSPFFKILPYNPSSSTKSESRVDGKIAAGMDISFLLEFSPQEVKELAFDVICCTERERFALPVRVRGRYAALDISDEIQFGICPVKTTTTKVLTVHNVGTRSAKFAFRTTSPFMIVPEHAILAQGAGVQLELRVTPSNLQDAEGELTILDDAGQTAVVQLHGDVKNLDVYLSAPLVEPNATYISLSSRKTIKICNDSEHPLEFVWKAFPDSRYEQLERNRLLEQLDRMEATELAQLDEGSIGDDVQSPFDASKAIETKYKHLRKAVMDDTMQFVNDCFSLTPISGRVWAHSEVDVVTCFTPAIALLYSCCAYLEIGGQEGRLPLQIRGRGIGPNARVVYNELLDFGEVFITDERTRDFTIQNKGEIPAVYSLIPVHPPEGMTLRVEPNQGTLAVNEMCKIEVSFSSQRLGDVFQPIQFALQGSEEKLSVRFKAVVVPPVFRFDVDQVDFGAISYSFPQTKSVKLINASKIAMNYTLCIRDEAHPSKRKEMGLDPSEGRLASYGEQEIEIHFTPMQIKSYEYSLVVNVAGVTSDLLRLPILAQSFVPDVVLRRPELNFGSCFLRYPHKQTLILENKSTSLMAQFEIAEQDDHSKAIASYDPDAFTGVLRPAEHVAVEISLSCEKVGPIRLPMAVNILGSTDLPLSVTLTAVGTGPIVELDQSELHWGNCTCLVDHERVLTMTNRSLIPASFKTFIRSARSKFLVDLKEGTIAPNDSATLVLTANLDDTILFKDHLHILVAEGENLIVPLAIKGTGTTMWSQSELKVIDFGYQMTTRECEWQCTLENKGKRAQILTWTNRTALRSKLLMAEAAHAAAAAGAKKGVVVSSKGGKSSGKSGNNSGGDASTDDVVPVFSVFPGTIELKPRTACVFVFKGLSMRAGGISEELVCETRVGKEKNNKVAFVTEICGDFVEPKLNPSVSSLQFEYIHIPPGRDIPRQSQPLSLTNVCALPLTFTMRTQPPFSLDCWEAELEPGEKVDFTVEFYPGYKDDHQCRVIQGKVAIAYLGHPQRDSVELIGDISFPNLSFETTKIDFGCTLNDTQKSLTVVVTNVSKVETAFRWVFVEDEAEARAQATAKKPYIPVNQVFDILPIRGKLQPGESETIEFLFYGHANRKFKSLVACEVEGGPEYELTLLGEASSLVYKLDKQWLDFGQVLYNKTEDREFSILNVGKVTYAFAITLENLTRGRFVSVAPMSGKIAPNDKQRILVQLRPGIPEPFEEVLRIEVAHFQPIEFKLLGSGVFAAVSMNLPRENHPASTIQGEDPKWRDLKKRARFQLENSVLNVAAIIAADQNASAGLANSESKTSVSTGTGSGTTAGGASKTRPLERGNSFASTVAGVTSGGVKSSSSPSKTGALSSSNVTLKTSGSGGAASSSGVAIDDLDVEIEACRMFFADYLVVQDRKRHQPVQAPTNMKANMNADDSEEARDGDNNSARSTETTRPEKKQSLRVPTVKPHPIQSPVDSFPFVLSQFVLDFGNVVLGTHKIKKFSVINIGHTPASFQLDKNLAQSRGFQIEPERVVRLPEKQPVEFTVTFQARKNVDLGLHQVQLPIAMKNGPPCLVSIRAVVTVPDIAISTDVLDFGRMAVGTCHTMYTQLQNVSSVSAEWAVKKPMGSARDLSNFRITPQSGVLAPGNKVNVQIEFIPDEERHYTLKLPVKVAANTKTRSITLRGEGSELRVSFAPPLVDLGPILPCSESTERVVELQNNSNYAIEVFSLDFDDVYKEDEELLRGLSGFGADDLMQLPIREPGEPMRDYLQRYNALPPVAAVEENPIDEPQPADMDEGIQAETTDATEVPDSSPDTAVKPPTPTIHDRVGIDYVVMGPPRSGKSTQARLLADRENLGVWSINEAIQQICLDLESPLGCQVRSVLGVEVNIPTTAEAGLEASQQPAQDNIDPKDTLEVPLPLPSLSKLLEHIVTWRLVQPDMKSGSVLDGWENALLPLKETLQACARVMQTARILWIQLDEDTYEALASSMSRSSSLARRVSRLTSSISKDRLTASSASRVSLEKPESKDGDNNDSSVDDMDANPDQVQQTSSLIPDATNQTSVVAEEPEMPLDAAIGEADNDPLSALKKDVEESIARHASIVKTLSFAEDLLEGAAIRRLLASFIARDRRTLGGMLEGNVSDEVRDDQNAASSLHQPTDVASTLESSSLLKTHSRADNFVLDVTFTDGASPPLVIHSALCSSMDKYIRELELSHLTLPPSAKLQVLRRPPQRFARKPILRFSLRRLPTNDETATDKDSASQGGENEEQTSSQTLDTSSPSSMSATRWVLPPHSSVPIAVQFASRDVGTFDAAMGFEIVGIRREFTLFCRASASVPQINTDPRNIFMSRVKSRAENAFVHKKFVISRYQFEFGPLIVPTTAPKSPQSEEDFSTLLKAGHTNNIETFRISNASKYPLRVDFALEHLHDPPVFSFAPSKIDVAENETREVKVWACPVSDGLYENALVCCVSDNPEPLLLAMSCYGCTPAIVLRGPWEQPAALSTAEEQSLSASSSTLTSARDNHSGAVSASPTPRPPTELGPVLDFEQLLLKRQDDKSFQLENTSAVAVAWRIVGLGEIPADFRIFPVEGIIKPFQKTPILVTFTASTEATYKHELQIEYSDTDSALQVEERRRTVSLVLQAEAYKIDVCSFESPTGGTSDGGAARDGSLDFGLVRVGETHTRSFNIRNRGKYNIKFVFSLRTTAARDLFKIEPMEMLLEPDKVASVQVSFQSRSEIALRDNKDIKCTIIEMLSGEPCADFHVLTSARSVFSRFRLQPNRGINFGPLKYSDKPKTKRVEIRNDGEFVFKYRVRKATSVDKDAASALALETPLHPTTLTVGQFSVSPDSGSVDPGTTAALEVTFQPKDCELYREMLQVEISGRNVNDTTTADALHYELVGESCYPGIDASDYESIFEEQIVVRTIGTDGNASGSAGSALTSFQTVIFAEKEKLFSFGAMIAAANSKGCVERFKISNPTKVSTTVQFQISTPSLPAVSGSDSQTTPRAPMVSAFTVQPSVWEIPPLEHRFVNVHFKPTAIMSYSAVFSARVDDSPAHVTTETLLQFEVRGEGTMPCIAILEPSHRDSNGSLAMAFGRVRTSKAKESALILRNDGILPATVLFSMQSNPNFLFANGNGSIVVAPHTTETLTVQFKPQKPHDEPSTSSLKITVQHNPFEETTIKLVGQGYRDDLVFEDLPFGHDDELHFDDIRLHPTAPAESERRSSLSIKPNVKVFSLCNQSTDIVRFTWPKSLPFSFSPYVGHIRPREYKLITATFSPVADGTPTSGVVFNDHKVALQAQRISMKEPHGGNDWDDTMQTVSFGGEGNEQSDPVAEPAYDTIGSPSTISLSCYAAADSLSYECDTKTIAFKRTFMLQVCSHRISLVNHSKIKLPYTWRWVRSAPFESTTSLGGPDGFLPLSATPSSSQTTLLHGNSLGDEDDECPFEIEPSSGEIAAGDTQSFVIRFAPMEVDDFDYQLALVIPPPRTDVDNRSSMLSTLRLPVTGSSLRPACHFDLERSEYAQHRAPHLRGPGGELGPLDPSVRVIEMESLGVRVRNTKRFYVVNPTNVSYEFTWTPEGESNACFRCATPKGLMLAGKRCEMIFEFTPQQLELQEMFWRFRIPHFQVNQLFLVVGTTIEPRVTLDRGSVNFNTLLIGTKTSQTVALINHEHIPFNFVFDKISLDFAGEAPALLVHPLSSVIPPNGRTLVDIEFIPTEEKSYNFNLNCIIKRKPSRLSLNVKGEGYSIHDALTISTGEDANDVRQAVLGVGNALDFGTVNVNESASRSVVIHNSGKFNFEFNWSLPSSALAASKMLLPPMLSIEPLQGTVKKNDKVTCRLNFAPTKPTSLDSIGSLTCTVAGARHYMFQLHGSALPPSVQFSFTSHDFGACFIADADAGALQSESVTLTIFNMDAESSVDLDCLFEKKPHLRVMCPPTVLGPRESLQVLIVFTARQETSYLELVPFIVNGSTTVTVSVRGEGVAPRVELANNAMQMVTFGSLQIGQQLSRAVKIINRAKRKTLVEFVDDELDDGSSNSLQALGISIFPEGEVHLKARESIDIEFRFSPTQRIVQFQRDIFIRIAGSRRKLLTLSGSCQGMDVQLETDTISFGTVCLGSQLVRKVHLQNRGDVPAKFQWNPKAFAPDFTISPLDGIVAPNHHKTLEVTFKPSVEHPDIRYERLCCVIGGTDPVFLTLVGACVKQATSSIQEVHFESRVREETSKSVVIENKTPLPWNLLPVVQGDHWSCPENIAVPAEGKATLNILYCPLTMTKQQGDDESAGFHRPELHQGSIFLAIPDGSALLYNMFGKAAAPVSAGTLTLSTPAKKSLSVTVAVKNWLKTAQTFAVEIAKPHEHSSVVAQGSPSITVQAAMTRNYQLKFYSYTEGVVPLVVRFVNQANGEYLQYEIQVTVSRAAEVDTLRLEAPVRQSVKKTITIENPFVGQERTIRYVDTESWWKCSSQFVRVRQLNDINARSEGAYEIEYRPTLHSTNETEATLTIAFVELGEYTYRLLLATQAAGAERVLLFKAPLGGSDIQTFSFSSFCDKSADVSCIVQQPMFFSVPTSLKVEPAADWEGRVHSVQVKFEPEALGEVRDTLLLESDMVGEYRCALQGVAVPPLPQGPFVFSGTKDIEFKNVFSSTRDFECVVDNPKFVLAAKILSIPAKTAKTISIKVDPTIPAPKVATSTSSLTAKLYVSCPAIKDLPPWVYYLEATLPSGGG